MTDMEDGGTKIDLVISWFFDMKTRMEELNFQVKGLQSKVTCLEEAGA